MWQWAAREYASAERLGTTDISDNICVYVCVCVCVYMHINKIYSNIYKAVQTMIFVALLLRQPIRHSLLPVGEHSVKCTGVSRETVTSQYTFC